MLLGGLWYGSEKPTMTTFLLPLLKSMNELYSKGKFFFPAVLIADQI